MGGELNEMKYTRLTRCASVKKESETDLRRKGAGAPDWIGAFLVVAGTDESIGRNV
jgi:hypothetical protein